MAFSASRTNPSTVLHLTRQSVGTGTGKLSAVMKILDSFARNRQVFVCIYFPHKIVICNMKTNEIHVVIVLVYLSFHWMPVECEAVSLRQWNVRNTYMN